MEATRPGWAWIPFGNGQRACIGRHFSFFESQLLLGLILQRFRLWTPLTIASTSPISFDQAENLSITVAPRAAAAVIAGPRVAAKPAAEETPRPQTLPPRVVSDYGGGNRLLVLYGSNLGTSGANRQ